MAEKPPQERRQPIVSTVFVPCSCAPCNRHNSDDAPPRRGGAADTTSGLNELAGGRHPRPARSGARRLQPPNLTRPPPLAPPRPTRPCRGDAPRDARLSAPRAAPLLPLWRDTAAVAAWRGGERAHTPPDVGGRARHPPRSCTFLCWGGGQAPAWGASPPPPMYLPMGAATRRPLQDRRPPAPTAAPSSAAASSSSRVSPYPPTETTPLPRPEQKGG